MTSTYLLCDLSALFVFSLSGEGMEELGLKNRFLMSSEALWQGCHRGRKLARQGRTGQNTCKTPMAEPCPPLYRQSPEPHEM